MSNVNQPLEAGSIQTRKPLGARAAGVRLNNTALVVLGMHRSGTSAITGCFYHRGVYFGRKLLPADVYNPKGFFEHKDIYALHEELFAALGSRYDDPRPLPDNLQADSSVAPFRERLRAILLRDFTGHPLWGIKDPRICRLLPLWMPLLEELNVTVKALHVIRDPVEIAASLKKRNPISLVQAMPLWLQHVLPAELATRGFPRSVVLYEDMIASWRGELERIEKELDLPLSEITPDVEARLDDFLDPDLRHHKNQKKGIVVPFKKPVWIAFNAFVAWRRDNIDPAPVLTEIGNIMQNARSLSHKRNLDSPIVSRKKHSTYPEIDAAKKDAYIAKIEIEMTEKDDYIAYLEASISHLKSKEETLEQIYSSNGWKALTAYYRLKYKLLQLASTGGQIYHRIACSLKRIYFLKQVGIDP